jgi:MFS family permease
MYRTSNRSQPLIAQGSPATTNSGRNLLALDLLNFFKADAQTTFGPFLATYLMTYHHWHLDRIGIVMSVPGFVTIFAQTPAGALVDATKRKRELTALCGLAIAAVCFEVVHAGSLPAVALAMGLFGLATIILPPAITAVTMGLVGHRRFAQRLGRNETISHAGAVAAAICAGAIGAWIAPNGIFYFAALMSFGLAAAALAIRGSDIDHSMAREAVRNPGEPEHITHLRELFTDTRIVIFALAVILFHFANAAQLPLVSEMLSKRQPEFSPLYTAVCVLLAQTVMMPVAWMTGRAVDVMGRKPIFLLALAMLPIRAFLFASFANPYLLTSFQLLDGVSAGIFGVVSVVIAADLAHGTGRFNLLQGVVATCVAIGGSLSNLSAGFLVQHAGFPVGFVTLAVIAVGAFAFFQIMMPETRPGE